MSKKMSQAVELVGIAYLALSLVLSILGYIKKGKNYSDTALGSKHD